MKSDVMTLRPVMDAKKFIEDYRRKFPSLYPSDMAFFANSLLSSSSFGWEKGLIVSDDNTRDCPFQLTEDGWKSFVNSDHIPFSWSEPHKTNPLFCIPDDASKEWLEAISMFCYRVEKISEDDYRAYVTAKMRLGMMAKTYQEESIQRYVSAFVECKKLLKHHEVHARCNTLLYQTKGYKEPLPLKKGSVVRLRNGVSTAVVQSDELTFGNGKVKGACYLDKPLGGTQYWNKDDLVVVENPSAS
jgi:hypothetical protein